MPETLTIQGARFEIPDAVIGRYQIGTPLNTEGEVSTMRQILRENLRNNFASKVKAKQNGGELNEAQIAELQNEFTTYAESYQFGVRAVGTGTRVIRDPLEKEVRKLMSDAIKKAFKAKYGENPDKDQLAAGIENLYNAKYDDYAKRAKAILRQREQAGVEDLEAAGL
jgi:hypothetical protein